MTTEATVDTTPIVTTKDEGTLEQRKAFLKAFAIAQGAFQPIVKNRSVTIKPRDTPSYSFRFADMQEIDAKTRPHLSANGISITGVMIPNDDGKGVWLALVMAHEEGFERRNEVFVGYGEDIKQFGARLSYMRRYMKTTILDVTADDDLDDRDDGSGAGSGDDAGGGDGAAVSAPSPAPAKRTPAPAKRTPARRASTPPASPSGDQEPPPDNEPPPEGLTKEQLEEQRQRDLQRQSNAQQAQQRITASAPAVQPADNPAAGAEPRVNSGATVDNQSAETGELCEIGERNYLLKRAKSRGADLRVALDALGFVDHLNATTLDGLLKSQFKAILTKI